MTDGTALAELIAERRDGAGEPMAMVGEFRRALVLVPVEAGGLWTAESGGVRWICAFTEEAALARFARARDTGDGRETGRSWEFARMRGARLLDEIVPAMGVPAGVAVDIADPDGSMVFPPVRGIVPDAVAVDAPAEGGA
ncbi:SseB family protein [Streptomyces sp. NPDC015346]|uniref:SseB family protein n=1 Tax=Streptomyces sp. NPDC015346 TaxID=3364954 RepID=UPI0036FC16A6